ncbi:MAG: nucleoside hydrolase [Nakamurella sp.]
MTTPVPMFLDCDTGIDDAMALVYLLNSPDIDLVGVATVSGNIDAAGGARNTLDLLALAGRADIPVAVGNHDPQAGHYDGGAPHVHGDNGIGNVTLPRSGNEPAAGTGAELLVKLARQYRGRLHVVAIAPLTNLAEALRLEPDLPNLVSHVTIMGGAALVPGNITAVAEANIGNDPEAAAEVFAASWDLTLVPLDVTMSHRFDEADRQELLSDGRPVPVALGEMLDYYFGFYFTVFGDRHCALHDPLAAAIAVGAVIPDLAPTVRVAVEAGSGPSRGQTVCDLRGRYRDFPPQSGAHCRVVLTAPDGAAAHIKHRLLAAPGG